LTFSNSRATETVVSAAETAVAEVAATGSFAEIAAFKPAETTHAGATESSKSTKPPGFHGS
jgi:hypothetical protein